MIQNTPLTYVQSPRDKLDYAFDFSDWLLENESIASFTITTLPAGLTVSSTNGIIFVSTFLSSGVVNVSYNILCKITTDAIIPRVKEAEFYLTIRDN